MKKIKIISLLVLTIFLFNCTEREKKKENTFTVSGTIKGLDTDYMRRGYENENKERVFDSIFVKDGSFTYTGKITKPTHITFYPNVERVQKRTGPHSFIPTQSSSFAFFASPGNHIVFKGHVTDFVNAYPSGTNANDDLAKINSSIFPLMNKSANLRLLLRQNKLTEDDITNKQVLEDSIKVIDEQVLSLKKEFVSSNPNSQAATWYLLGMMVREQFSNEEAIKIFENIDSTSKEYTSYKEVALRIKGMKSTLIGETFPSFTTKNTMDGTEFQFNSLLLKEKYILIDFWGTWCGPCVAEMPKVKEYQEKYKDKLTILGINFGDTKERIEEFLTPKNYNWKQILSGKGNDDFSLKFNVGAFPTKFIIDPNGKILYRFVGDGEESFAILDELLKE